MGNRPRTGVLAAMVRIALVTMGSLLINGCCALPWRCPSDERVVAAREQARLGLESMHRGRLPEAQARLEHALSRCPQDSAMRHDLAIVLWKQGEEDRAIEELDQAIRGLASEPEWIVELGNMLLARGEIGGALEAAERAMEIDRDLGSAWQLRGDIRRQQQQVDQAMDDYHRALICGDDSGPLLLKLSDVYRFQGRYRRALATLNRYVDEVPPKQRPPYTYFLIADTMQSLGHDEDAILMFEEALRIDGTRVDSLVGLAASAWRVGDRERAYRAAIDAAELSPHDPRIQDLLAHFEQPSAQLASMVQSEEPLDAPARAGR